MNNDNNSLDLCHNISKQVCPHQTHAEQQQQLCPLTGHWVNTVVNECTIATHVGEPPSRASAIRSDSNTAHPLSGLAREVHCMDLKTQTALQRWEHTLTGHVYTTIVYIVLQVLAATPQHRIRDLGTQLARDHSTEGNFIIVLFVLE